jgi:hypothetical protein
MEASKVEKVKTMFISEGCLEENLLNLPSSPKMVAMGCLNIIINK